VPSSIEERDLRADVESKHLAQVVGFGVRKLDDGSG
jgi:hypothetical protein